MKVAVIFATKYGFTEKCAELLSEGVKCETKLINLKKEKAGELDNYDLIVLGSSVYAGKIQKEMIDFIGAEKEKLITKKIALFSCNMHQGEEGEKQLKNIFPKEIYDNSFFSVSFGGKFDFNKMNFLEKVIVKKIAKVEKDVENIELENIKLLQDKINEICLKG